MQYYSLSLLSLIYAMIQEGYREYFYGALLRVKEKVALL
jgi:hypothetical protein